MTNQNPYVILEDDMLEELIQTRVSPQMKTAFEEAARREGRPASEILRLLITDWVQRMYPDLLRREAGGEFRTLEAGSEQETSPRQAVSSVLCWRCHGWISWRIELGPQGYCPHCGAFIDLRIR